MIWLVVACAPAIEDPPPADLPDRVSFRTATESFNRWWYFAVRDGKIWLKPNEETGERKPGAWELVGRSGLPEGGGLVRWDEPTDIAEISADGAHLQAISTDGHFYRATDARHDLRDHAQWTDRWGRPAARGPGLSTSWSTARGWSVSDSQPFQVAHYEDVNDEQHSVGLGMAHVYRLTEDGRQIAFNDWWLPAAWSRRICGPERGTFQAMALSASASTILLLGRDGAVWTRLYDFDTSGENDLLRYSWVLDGRDGKTRALPAEPWFRQPDLPGGRPTNRIAMAQDGKGKAARVLRVEAEVDGVGGYREKHVVDDAWTWVETGGEVGGAFLDTLPPDDPPVDPADVGLIGGLSRDDTDATVDVDLLDFNLLCSPARARLSRDGRPITAGRAPVELAFHHVMTTGKVVRPDDALEQDAPIPVRGALVLDLDVATVDDPGDRDALIALFGDRPVIDWIGTATRTTLALDEIPGSMAGRVPYRVHPGDRRARPRVGPRRRHSRDHARGSGRSARARRGRDLREAAHPHDPRRREAVRGPGSGHRRGGDRQRRARHGARRRRRPGLAEIRARDAPRHRRGERRGDHAGLRRRAGRRGVVRRPGPPRRATRRRIVFDRGASPHQEDEPREEVARRHP